MIVKKIRAMCADRGISTTKLEQTVGLGNGVIGKWSVSSPNLTSLKKIAGYFDCTVDELLEENNEES